MQAETVDNGGLPETRTVLEVARDLRMSRSAVYNLMDKGELEYVKIGRCRRIPARAVRELVERNTVRVKRA
jgi:excisionase family DNA binding protein